MDDKELFATAGPFPDWVPVKEIKIFLPMLLAVILATVFFLANRNFDIPLSDEGYLWYGVTHTAEGEIPQYHFRAYEPFRYYWSAAWTFIFGKGVGALRLSFSILHALAIWIGLLAAKRVIKNILLLIPVGVLITCWSLPYFKIYEHFISIAAVYVATLLIEKPSHKRYFLAGILVGFAAIVGRNHGLYIALGFCLIMLLIWLKSKPQGQLNNLSLWAAGIFTGFLPMILLLTFTPGMWEIYLREYIFVYFNGGSTNLHTAIPAFWNPGYIDYQNLLHGYNLFKLSISFIYLLIPFFFAGVIFWLFRRKKEELSSLALLTASSCIGIFYLHHAFDRADYAHLSPAIQPFNLAVVAIIALLYSNRKRVASLSLACLIAWLALTVPLPKHPRLRALRHPEQVEVYQVFEDKLVATKHQVRIINALKNFVAEHVRPEEDILIAPSDAGFYQLIEKDAPLYNVRFLPWKESNETQKRMISQLKENDTRWAFLRDFALDGRDDLRMQFTHPLVWKYIHDNFQPVPVEGLYKEFQFWKRKSNSETR